MSGIIVLVYEGDTNDDPVTGFNREGVAYSKAWIDKPDTVDYQQLVSSAINSIRATQADRAGGTNV